MALKGFLRDKYIKFTVANVLLTASVLTVACVAWYASVRNVNNDGIDVFIDGVGTSATLETFHYHTNMPSNDSEIYGELLVDNEGNPINTIDLYTYESIFKYRNVYTPIVHRVGISGLSQESGSLTLNLNRRSFEGNLSDTPYQSDTLPPYVSSIIGIKCTVSSSIYDESNATMFTKALNAFSSVDDEQFFTTKRESELIGYEKKKVYEDPEANTLGTTNGFSGDYYIQYNGKYWALSGTQVSEISDIDQATLFTVARTNGYYTFQSGENYIGYSTGTTAKYNIGQTTPTSGWTMTGNSSGYGFYYNYTSGRTRYYFYLGNPIPATNTSINRLTSTSTNYNKFLFMTRSYHEEDDTTKPIYSDPSYIKDDTLSFNVNYTNSDFNDGVLYVYFLVDYNYDLVSAMEGSASAYQVGHDIKLANDLANIEVIIGA